MQPAPPKEESLFSWAKSFKIPLSITLRNDEPLGTDPVWGEAETSRSRTYLLWPWISRTRTPLCSCSCSLSGRSESHRPFYPLGRSICLIKTTMDSLDQINCSSRPLFPLRDGEACLWGVCCGAGTAMNPLWLGGDCVLAAGESQDFLRGLGAPGVTAVPPPFWGNQTEMCLRWKISSLFFWPSMSKWLVFTPEEENALKMSEFARNRNAEWSVASLFLGQWCHKGPKRWISQLRARTSLRKHHCFLKLSQTEGFKAFSRTANLPVLGLLSKRFLGAGGCKGGCCISWSSWKGLAASSAIPPGKV